MSEHLIVLWDIDNTLLYSGGAGSLAMTRAFRDLYGVDDAFRLIEFSGRTDAAIFTDCARCYDIADERIPAERERFLEAYIQHLEPALHEVRGALMPGVSALLDALDATPHVTQALGTGNFRRGSELKLRHYDIARYFPGLMGGFGEDSESRDAMIGIAIKRLVPNGTRPRVAVIGDTPHDVTAARANDAFALAVATGRNSVEELKTAGADATFATLEDTKAVLRALGA